jgi:hypothetical protein
LRRSSTGRGKRPLLLPPKLQVIPPIHENGKGTTTNFIIMACKVLLKVKLLLCLRELVQICPLTLKI